MVGHNVRFAFVVGMVAGHMCSERCGFRLRLGDDGLLGGFAQTQLARQLSTRPMGAPLDGASAVLVAPHALAPPLSQWAVGYPGDVSPDPSDLVQSASPR